MNTSLRSELDEALSAVIAEMQGAIAALGESLADERKALDQADSTALNHAGDRKRSLLAQLEQLDVERQQLLREAGATNAAQQSTWDRVLEALHDCQRTNQRNGNIIAQRLKHVRQALSVLTGKQDETGIYGPAGQLSHGCRSLPLARI